MVSIHLWLKVYAAIKRHSTPCPTTTYLASQAMSLSDVTAEQDSRIPMREAVMSVSIEVSLLSGKTLPIEVDVDVSLDDLSEHAQRALETSRGRLVNSFGRVLEGSATIRQSRLH